MIDPKSSETHNANCPLAAVDRRLADVHRHWHAAEKAYFDPEGFRANVQTAIQTLRTVTFILQSNKKLIPDFDQWYAPWQEKLNADALMRWMVNARNKIEKQGDLEAHSFVRAEIVASYFDNGPRIEVSAKLFDGTAALLKGIPESDVGNHLWTHGTLRIQRRWVENTLPDHELLDAVATAYGKLSQVVNDAHVRTGIQAPVTIDAETGEAYNLTRDGRLPCMIGHGEIRTANISLSDGKRFSFEKKVVELNPDDKRQSAKRYGIPANEVMDLSGDQERVLTSIFDTARRMIEVDGYHVTLLFMLKGSKVVQLVRIEFPDHGSKYVIMRDMAHEVDRHSADGVILIGEMWSAKADPSKPYLRAADAAERVEILGATLVRKEGSTIELVAKIAREDDRVSLEGTQRITGGDHFMFAPIFEVWGRPISGRPA